MPKVLSALRKLKEIHSEYKDIFINTALSEEEMFNEHEQSANNFSAPNEEMDIESNDLNENTEEQSNENEHDDSMDDTENTAEEQSRGLALDTCLQPQILVSSCCLMMTEYFALPQQLKTVLLAFSKLKNFVF